MKCIWCNKKLEKEEVEKNLYFRKEINEEGVRFCSEECKDEYMKFCKDVEKNKNKFLAIIFGSLVIYIIGVIALNNFTKYQDFIAGGYFILLGAILIRYPYGTPETNKALGIKKTIKLIRIMGAICILGSIVFMCI